MDRVFVKRVIEENVMEQKLTIDDIYITHLDVWEEFWVGLLHTQSNSLRSGLSSIHPEQSDNGLVSQWIEFSQRQLENWTEIEQELVSAIFHTVKEIDFGEGLVSEAGIKSVHRFFDHWESRAGKVFETHREFYALIFPWNDGEAELEDIDVTMPQETKKEAVYQQNAAQAA